MDKEQAHELLKQAEFVFAKTMPENPHWYTLKKSWEDPELFEKLVMFIRKNGVREKYKRSWYVCYYYEDFKYWTMGWPADQTTLINKASKNKDNVPLSTQES